MTIKNHLSNMIFLYLVQIKNVLIHQLVKTKYSKQHDAVYQVLFNLY